MPPLQKSREASGKIAAGRTERKDLRKPPNPIDKAEMGKRLRAIRKARGLTLKEVSAQSGVTLPTLSKMELGQVAISYDKLAAVARALTIDVGNLLEGRSEEFVGPRPTVVKIPLGSSPSYASDHYDHFLLAADFPGKSMTPAFAHVRAHRLEDFTDYTRHPGQEFLLVMSGSIRIAFETGESVTLATHEAAYFDSGVGHVYVSIGRNDAKILMLMQP